MPKRLPPECEGCPFAGEQWGYCPPDRIGPQTKLVIIGRDPGKDEVAIGRGFVGAAGRKLRLAEKMAGLRTGWVQMRYSDVIGIKEPPGGSEVAHANTRLCRPPKNEWGGLGPQEQCWQRHLERWLADWKGPILVTGIEALTFFREEAVYYDSATGRYAARGGWFPWNGRKLWFTVHPSFIARGGKKGQEAETKSQSDFLPLLVADIQRAVENADPPLFRGIRRGTPAEALAAWRDAGRPGPISIDVEEDQVIGLTWDAETIWEIPWSEENARAVGRFWAEGGIPLFHYASYDLEQLCHRVGGTLPDRWYDTIVMAAVINPSVPKNLASLVLTYVPGSLPWKGLVDIEGKGSPSVLARVEGHRQVWTEALEQLGRYDLVPEREEGWEPFYNALDVAWTWHLYHGMLQEMEERQERYWREFMLPLQRPLLDMGWRGIPARQEEFRKLAEEIDRQIEETKKVVDRFAGPLLDRQVLEAEARVQLLVEDREAELLRTGERKYSRAKDLAKARAALRAAIKRREEGFNLKSSLQRKALLNEFLGIEGVKVKGRKEKSTGEQAIEEIIKRLEGGKLRPKGVTKDTALEILRALDRGSKLRTLKANFLKVELDEAGRVRTLYHLHRTDTGRLSSGFNVDDSDKTVRVSKSAMQLQNMPRFVRKAFVAEPGMVFVGGDWAAIEWVLSMLDAGLQLNDPPGFHLRMVEKFFRKELDPHRYLASYVFGKPEKEITTEERKFAKQFTFGYLFEGTPHGLSKQTGIPVKDVVRACEAHDEAFKLAAWRRHTAETGGRNHVIITMGGWNRWFWDPFVFDKRLGKVTSPKPTELCNTRIQGTAADLMKWTLRRMFEEKPDWVEIITTTHDSFLLQVPEERGEEGAAWLKEMMEAPVPWLGNRRFRAEVKVGRTWADV